MKKMTLLLLLCACAVPARAGDDNPFVYRSGGLSLGIAAADTLALYDIFKRAADINARIGASVTLARYERLGLFLGAAAPTACPENVAVVGGPSLELDDLAKSMLKALLEALPFKLDEGSLENISKCARLKLYGGYDFRYKSAIAGAGFGIALF